MLLPHHFLHNRKIFERERDTDAHVQHWGGDCESTFEAMAEALRGALSLTLSGFAFASHDIGGFEVSAWTRMLFYRFY